MKFGSVCSGIEAASCAWEPLGWQCQFVSEIEPFPCAVLKHHYPDVPNCGDMTKYKEWPVADIDVLVGGTPCQSFSVAGLRRGMDDPRGNLALAFLGIADRMRPRWVVWENVPGVLSSNGGRDFGTFLGGLAECGYGWSYRILDAQYFGVAQRRRRVFVVGHLGDWRPSAAVLLERESLRGNTATRGVNSISERETAGTVTTRTGRSHDNYSAECGHCIVAENGMPRWLTPKECERLQGFPDDWTLVPYRGRIASDGPRYHAIGNSMAVPVMRWIGSRIQAVSRVPQRTISPSCRRPSELPFSEEKLAEAGV